MAFGFMLMISILLTLVVLGAIVAIPAFLYMRTHNRLAALDARCDDRCGPGTTAHPRIVFGPVFGPENACPPGSGEGGARCFRKSQQESVLRARRDSNP